MSCELEAMQQTALAAARAGGRVLMEHFGRVEVDYKGEVDLVTDADRQAEQAVVAVIRDTFPDHAILAEEEEHGRRGGPWRWIIDPLDGTTNYAHRFPWFAVSLAFEKDGEVVVGVVYNPLNGELFRARRGAGAYLNDRRLEVSSTAPLNRALLATGFPYDRRTSEVNNFDHFINFQRRAQGCRRAGAASLDLAYVAAGRLDGFWELKLKPWDVAAGQLLVKEAGGRLSDFAGEPLDIYRPEIIASNGRIHDEMVAVLAMGSRP